MKRPIFISLLCLLCLSLYGEENSYTLQKESIALPEIKLVGISVRTNNEKEQDKMKGNIFPCVVKYFHSNLAASISHRVHPGTTYCSYTDYESDYTGDYTYFIGEEVSMFPDPLPEGLETHVIPKQYYTKFTTPSGPMPDVLVNAWNAIWRMSEPQIGGKRNYQTDFEIYDERSVDHNNLIIDLYIGIHPNGI